MSSIKKIMNFAVWAIENREVIERETQKLWNTNKCATWTSLHSRDGFEYQLVIAGYLTAWGKTKRVKMPQIAAMDASIARITGAVLFPNATETQQTAAGYTLLCGLQPANNAKGLTYVSVVKGFRNLPMVPQYIEAFNAAINAGLPLEAYVACGLDLGEWKVFFENARKSQETPMPTSEEIEREIMGTELTQEQIASIISVFENKPSEVIEREIMDKPVPKAKAKQLAKLLKYPKAA